MKGNRSQGRASSLICLSCQEMGLYPLPHLAPPPLHTALLHCAGMRLSSAPSFQSAPPSSRGMRLITTAGNCMGNTKGGTRRCGLLAIAICANSAVNEARHIDATLQRPNGVRTGGRGVSRSRKHFVGCRARTRTSGYRARRLTPGGRHVLRNRRKKGRKILTPASNYKK